MKTFKDNAGRTWTIVIHVTAVRKCRALAGVDLYGLVDRHCEGLGELLNDPVKFVDTLYVLCADEAKAQSVTDEDFGRSLYGDAIGHASEAFVAELVDFFPSPAVRAGLTKFLEKTRAVEARLQEMLSEAIEGLDANEIASTSRRSSGSSQESSESTPDLSPSESSS